MTIEDNMPEWIKTGSIVTMLEEEGICYFKNIESGEAVCGGVYDIYHITMYPEMLRHLAWELNKMADTLEKQKTS